MIALSAAGWDLGHLRAQWLAARPFPHLVLDGLLPAGELPALVTAFAAEPMILQADEHFCFRGGAEPPQEPRLRALALSLQAPELLAAVSAISGREVCAAHVRAYAYARGCYLLPHSDCRPHEDRVVAFAWYLAQQVPLRGGALELFDCELEEGETPAARTAVPAMRIEPRVNRLVLFDVAPAGLHQVCEVTQGERLSLAGWFTA